MRIKKTGLRTIVIFLSVEENAKVPKLKELSFLSSESNQLVILEFLDDENLAEVLLEIKKLKNHVKP